MTNGLVFQTELHIISHMKQKIRKSVKNSNTLEEVRDKLFEVFRKMRELGHQRIGYVAGAITADGRENIPRNIEILAGHTKKLRYKHDIPIFSATDVFDDALFDRLDKAGFVNADWEVFWREVLGTEEKFVTDMFMTPGWERSSGATDEHEVAKEMQMTIVYVEV